MPVNKSNHDSFLATIVRTEKGNQALQRHLAMVNVSPSFFSSNYKQFLICCQFVPSQSKSFRLASIRVQMRPVRVYRERYLHLCHTLEHMADLPFGHVIYYLKTLPISARVPEDDYSIEKINEPHWQIQELRKSKPTMIEFYCKIGRTTANCKKKRAFRYQSKTEGEGSQTVIKKKRQDKEKNQ